MYWQSSAIEIFLARKYDLMSKNYDIELNIFFLTNNDLVTYLTPLVRPDMIITHNKTENFINNILQFF